MGFRAYWATLFYKDLSENLELEVEVLIMSENKWEKQIAYLGPEASFTYLATKGLFPNDWHIPFKSIPECIEAVSNEKVELAVVPVENALEGSVP